MQRLYERLGPRYPRLVVRAELLAAHGVAFAGLLLLRIYQPMSWGEFWLLLAIVEAIVLLDNVLAWRTLDRLLEPVEAWLSGPRTEVGAEAAWRALVGLPREIITRRWFSVAQLVPMAVAIVLVLHLWWWSGVIALVGGLVVLLYGIVLRYLSVELTVRPPLTEVAQALPDGARLTGVVIPLRWKVLAGLPAVNIITGVLVAALSGGGQADLGDLGLDVVFAIAVAFTISMELTLLLARSITDPVRELQRATERVAAGDLDVRVPVVSTDETGQLTASFNEMVAGLSEREALRDALGIYVDPELAERILHEGTLLEGEDVEVTVLFVDIRGFTAFAERASAREVVTELNRFYERVVPLLIRHGGHANKFVGDGLLGVVGAPDRRPDHADRGVAAALEIAAMVRDVYGERLRIGIGVNSGEVVAGTVGGGGRLEFTVIGDVVNTAARVEACTRETGDELLITEATRRLLTRELVDWEERPPTELKGKSERVRLWAPVSAAPRDGRTVATPARRSPAR